MLLSQKSLGHRRGWALQHPPPPSLRPAGFSAGASVARCEDLWLVLMLQAGLAWSKKRH